MRPQHSSSARVKRENICRILTKIEGNSGLLRDILVRILQTIGRFESCWSYAEVSMLVVQTNSSIITIATDQKHPMLEMFDYSIMTLMAVMVCALLTGILHGATGMAGGILMAAILSHQIGIKMAIPVMTVALVISHSSRVFLYLSDIDWPVVKRVLLFSTPTIVIGSTIFTYLNATTIAIIMAVFLSLSIPIKAWARQHKIKTSPSVLAGASSVWGLLAGNVIGPGFFLAPFLLGTGMNRLTFVGSLACIVLLMNVLKLLVFGANELMSGSLILVGAVIGLLTIPGNWLGKRLLEKMSDLGHSKAVDIMTVLLVINFIYLAIS